MMIGIIALLSVLTVDPPFCDHAVLQREKPVLVRGSADPGAEVVVSFAGNAVHGVADSAGRWAVKLPPMPASKEPRTLTVSQGAQTSLTISDVLVGEVWLASGQSNMEMPLWHPTRKRFRDKMGGLMRQFPPNRNYRVMMTWPERGISPSPRRDYPVAWTVPDEEWLSTNKFSACAYYFGRELLTTLDVPVGVIAAFWGGTEIGFWVPDCGWESVKDEPYVSTNILGRVEKRRTLEKDGKRRDWPQYPGDLWNEQVAVFAPYTVRGMIWYQGESNIDENFSGRLAYSKDMRALMDGWRREFCCPDLKLLFVELAPFSYPWLNLKENDDRLARLCDEQQCFEREEPDAHLACISDIGDVNDIHPCRKLEVGIRLAGLAYQHVYGMPVRADAPRAVQAKLVAPGKVEIELRNAHGLYRWMPEVSLWTERQHEDSPIRFVCADGKIVDCESEIVGDRIVVWNDSVANPIAVTHLRRCTDESNIYNSSGLPLGTFILPVEAGESESILQDVATNAIRFEDERGVFAEMTRPDPSVIDLKVERQGDFTVLTVAPAKGAKREVRELALPEIRIVREIANARTLGSGGLKSLGEDVGSYTFLAVAEPQTRKGIVAAFATSETGSGVIFSESRDGRAVLKPVLHYGRLRLGDGETVKGETFLVGAFNDCREGLECYGDYVAAHYGVELKRQPSGYCTYYSDKFDHSGTEESTKVFMEQSDKLIPWGFDFYQIDGSWQNGEKAFQLGQPKDTGPINRRFTDHDPDGTYPHGMKDAARTIAAKGVTPGLWFMPFSANTGDSWFNDKRDLFVTSDVARKRPADPAPDNYRMNQVPGAPYETFWGGTAFDMTNPKTCRYVEDEIRNMTRNWGYRYLKYDGIWVAMACEHIYISDAYREDDIGFQTFFDPKATNISAFRRGAELVRKAAGEGTFLLGCNCAQNMRIMAGAYGLVDAMRIGPDNNASWDGVCRGPIRGTPRYFLNGRVWYNDPDPVYVRNSIPASRARNSATWVSLSGSLYAFSDWLPDLSAERLDILRRTLAPHRRPTKVRPVDLFESDLANTWLLADGESSIFGFFNWDEKKSLSIDYDTKYAGLDPKATYVGFDFWNNRFVEPFRGKIKTEVGAGDAKVWQLREFDGTRPVLVSTSRHIASPLFEVAGETWDADNRTLSGLSEIVLDDPYELRIVMPEGFVVEAAEIAGTKAEVGVEYRAVRICVTPRRSGAAEWCIRFASTR